MRQPWCKPLPIPFRSISRLFTSAAGLALSEFTFSWSLTRISRHWAYPTFLSQSLLFFPFHTPTPPTHIDRQTPLTMEALLNQSRAMCPFLKKTSPATLRSLSTATHQSPGGGTITNLQFIARRCPVMNKALAVQSARIRTASYTKAATGAGTAKSLLEKKLHTSAEKKASVDTNNVFNKRQQGLSRRLLCSFTLCPD